MSKSAWILFATVMAIGMAALAFSNCAPSMETVIERAKADCESRDGEWTTFGCIHYIPRDSVPSQSWRDYD